MLRSEYDQVARPTSAPPPLGPRSSRDERPNAPPPTALDREGLLELLRRLNLRSLDEDVRSIITPITNDDRARTSCDDRDDLVSISFPQLATSAPFHKLLALRVERIKAIEKGSEQQDESHDQHLSDLVMYISRACEILNDGFYLLDRRKKGIINVADLRQAMSADAALGEDDLMDLFAGKQQVPGVGSQFIGQPVQQVMNLFRYQLLSNVRIQQQPWACGWREGNGDQ